jgi:cytidylate kinase
MTLNYNNITISGGVAVGKGTLMKNLKTYLEPMGWHITSGGKLLREYTKESIQPLARLAPDEFHHKLDDRTMELLEKGKCVIEAWLAGFMAREREDTLRLFLTCSNEALSIDRLANRDNIPVAEAKKNIKERQEENFKEWRRIYGDYDFFSPEYYHLVIDTYSSGPEETVQIVLDKLGYIHNNE